MDNFKKIENVSNPFNNAPVYYIDKINSTMKLAEEYCSSFRSPGELSGTIFMAGRQTSGRGRIPGRIWEAPADQNLLFTLILSSSEMGKNPLPVIVGLGLAKYLEKNHFLKPHVKWPNDIYVNGRKIAGIIIESRKGFFNIGIGININQVKFSKSILDSATSLAVEKKKTFNLFLELELILSELKEVLSKCSWQDEINSRLYNVGNEVSVSTGIPGSEKVLTGFIKGVGPEGQLLLRHEGSLVEIFSGEIAP